jgi:aspartyl-tRNA(Asn)/glutamyl-tRNA(Gln) amidotransferase subunit B
MAQRTVQSYKVLVGMEIHVQLATESKMFTAAPNGSGNLRANDVPPEPNTLIDPVVLGLPGVLPVINQKAVEYAIKVGLALGCKIARHTKWDRKSYYYPDLPKNYQISQYDQPLCSEGKFDLADEDGTVRPLRIRRAHLEEDAGKLMHEAPGGYAIDHSIVDLNRAGTPLLEVVTEPDLASPRQVAQFAQELQKLVQFLGVSHGQMQLGQMRFEPNINVHITDGEGIVHKTAVTEIKNLNSFSVLERATQYEIDRQVAQWVETGELGRKGTYGWDEAGGRTVHQRDKEEAHDYRYFPDPDLVPVNVDDAWLMELKSQVGELPQARRRRYAQELGLPTADAAMLASERSLGEYYEQAVAAGAAPRRTANLVIQILGQLANRQSRPVDQLGIAPVRVAETANLIDQQKLSAANALPLFESLLQNDAPAEAAAAKLGLLQVSDDSAIDAAIDAMLASNPQPLQDFRAGKQSAIGALVGLVMRSGKGLNPKLVQQRLREKL